MSETKRFDNGMDAAGEGSELRHLFDQVTSSDVTPLKMRCIIEGVGRNANADRCYVYNKRDADGTLFDNVYEWCAEGIAPIIERQKGADMADFPDMLDAIEHDRIWSFTDIAKVHPSTRMRLEPQGVKAIILAPFHDSAGAVAGCVGFDFITSHPDPIPADVVRNLLEAANMITFCIRAQRERADADATSVNLLKMGVGLFAIELDGDKPPRMYGNKVMDELLCCDGLALTPEEYYHAWYDNINPAHYDEVNKTLENLKAGYFAEAQYPFNHPIHGELWVRSAGRIDSDYAKGVRILGAHYDVTELQHLQKDNAAEISAAHRLAEAEMDRANKQRDVNIALELLVAERDFTRVLDKLMALWCNALGAQWSVLGEFSGGDFKVVHAYSVFGGEPLFEPGALLAYMPEISGEARAGEECDYTSVVDFQGSPAASALAQLSASPKVVRSIASCHSHVIRFKGARWGSIVLMFQDRHEFTDNELQFIAASAHGIELALLRREYDTKMA